MTRILAALGAFLAAGGVALGRQDPPVDVPPPAPAPGREIRLTLRECIHSAIEHNVDIEIARFQPWIEDQNVMVERGFFDHHLYSQVSAGEDTSKSSNPFDTSDIERSDFNGVLGVRRILPFGLQYDLSFRANRVETNEFFSSALNPFWRESLNLNVTMPLLRGRGEAATYTGVILAQLGRQGAVEQFETLLVDQIVLVYDAYWFLVGALQTLEVRKQSEQVAERLLDENRKKFEKGVMSKLDVTEAESGLASQREGILTAENAVHDASDRLKRLVDPELLRQDAPIVPADAPAAADTPLDESAALETALAQAFAKRADYRELAPRIAAQHAILERTASDILPRLDLTGAGGINGLDGSFGSANDEMRTLDFHNWAFGLVFEFPLENHSARGARTRADLERRRLELTRRNVENLIVVEVRGAVREIKTTEKRIEATRRARQLAREQFDAEVTRRDAGLRTTFHVIDAQQRLTEAATNEVRAVIDYNLALMRLQRSEGTLLERNGIVVADNLSPRHGR